MHYPRNVWNIIEDGNKKSHKNSFFNEKIIESSGFEFGRFTVQLPLLQLTYVKYMKVHNTKQQLLGFPIFQRGAK